jgi:uncharacterized membrane protein
MKQRSIILIAGALALLLLGGGPVWAKKQPPPTDPPPTPVEGFYFWRLGHMEGPHDSSMALGISRDGKTAVGSTVVVDFERAWRMDIDWAIATDDAVPPLFNELKVQEDIGIIAPSEYSAAYASSDMTTTPTGYDLPNLNLDWGGSMPVGTIMGGTVSYGIEWLLPVLDVVDEGDFVKIPDFGGGISDMSAKDVSFDGAIFVGTGNTKKGLQAFLADTSVVDEAGVPIAVQLTIQDFATLKTLQTSAAEAVSADGSVIAGYGSTNTGNRAFVTTVLDLNTDPVSLESYILPMLGGGKFAEAYAMTPDGTYIVGRSGSSKGPQACLWFVDETTGSWVVKPLGGLSKKSLDSVATGIAYRTGSAVGELIVVGRSKSILYPSEAFVWAGNPVLEDDEIGYFYDLEYILTKTGVAEASSMGSEWILNEATGISLGVDGTRIVGWGTNPEGGIEAWLVTGYPYDELVFTKE